MNTDLSESAPPSERIRHRRLTERLLKVFYDVYRELGGGFVESVYAHAYQIGLCDAGLPYERERAVPIRFRGHVVGTSRPDFIVDRTVIVECKAVRTLEGWQLGQVLHYLRATRLEVALLLNFGPQPSFKRIVQTAGLSDDTGISEGHP